MLKLINQDDIMIFTINADNISFKINVSKFERMERIDKFMIQKIVISFSQMLIEQSKKKSM